MYWSSLKHTLSKIIPYANEIIREYQHRFRRNRSTVDNIFIIRQILEKWEYNNEVCQLFIDFEKADDSIQRESSYHILITFGVPKNLVRLIKTCTDSKVRIGNYLSSSLPIENGLKQGDATIQFCTRIWFYDGTGNLIRTSYEWHPSGADDVNLMNDDITIARNADVLLNTFNNIG